MLWAAPNVVVVDDPWTLVGLAIWLKLGHL